MVARQELAKFSSKSIACEQVYECFKDAAFEHGVDKCFSKCIKMEAIIVIQSLTSLIYCSAK